MHKPVVLMQPGPIHLFWTTSVYYIWMLSGKFDFVLLVTSNYRKNDQFQKIANLPSVKHVEYMPCKSVLSRHYHYAKRFKYLLKEYSPKLILLHNRSYVENQYLLDLSRRLLPESIRFYYQNGRMSLMWENDFAARRAEMIRSLTGRFRFLSNYKKLVGVAIDLRALLASSISYKLLPLLLLGKTFNPPVNVFNGRIDRTATLVSSSSKKDHLLAYLEEEIEAYSAQGVENILHIRHPIQTVGDQVFQFLYGDFSVQNTILILPSYGFTSLLIKKGWSESKIVDHVSDKWCGAIYELLAKFPGFRLGIKLHPAASNDAVWGQIVKNICCNFPEMVQLAANESAESHVVRAKVIVSDVSTILWWAALVGEKIPISLDIFDYPGGGELKLYSNYIHYFTDPFQIKSIDLSESGRDGLFSNLEFDKYLVNFVG